MQVIDFSSARLYGSPPNLSADELEHLLEATGGLGPEGLEPYYDRACVNTASSFVLESGASAATLPEDEACAFIYAVREAVLSPGGYIRELGMPRSQHREDLAEFSEKRDTIWDAFLSCRTQCSLVKLTHRFTKILKDLREGRGSMTRGRRTDLVKVAVDTIYQAKVLVSLRV